MHEHTFSIISKKHDGRLHRKWLENTLFHMNDHALIGANFHTLVANGDGSQFCTLDPALFYFPRNEWFNVVIIFQPKQYVFYCNLASPFLFTENELTYIDYDIDIIVNNDYSYQIVDEQEFYYHSQVLQYPPQVIANVAHARTQLEVMIKQRQGPFSVNFLEQWYDKLHTTFFQR